MKYLWILLLFIPLFGQQIQKDGKVVQTFTYDEALEMLKARDAQWEGKIEKADSLISSQKVLITDYEGLMKNLEDQANLDSLIIVAKGKQIESLKSQNDANEKLTKLAKPSWYENKWLYFGYGMAAVTIPTYFGIKIVDIAN
jgi:hypothetical protein|tara:strand:- start:165 stop:590 length:426 start_codon:yes stop_codon:yes gene_type:complete